MEKNIRGSVHNVNHGNWKQLNLKKKARIRRRIRRRRNSHSVTLKGVSIVQCSQCGRYMIASLHLLHCAMLCLPITRYLGSYMCGNCRAFHLYYGPTDVVTIPTDMCTRLRNRSVSSYSRFVIIKHIWHSSLLNAISNEATAFCSVDDEYRSIPWKFLVNDFFVPPRQLVF